MDDGKIKSVLKIYADALEKDGKTGKSIISRKRDLKVALNCFKTKEEFEETITNNAKFAAFVRKLRAIVSEKKVADIKNAVSCYAKLCLSVSVFTKPEIIKDALKKYSEAIQAFDSFGEFDTVNIVGEYGEYYICRLFKLDRAFTNEKAYDAVFKENGAEKKVQIKTRWYRGCNLGKENIEFGSIKPNEIDYFVGVIFNIDFSDALLIVMNKKGIEDYFSYHKRNKKAIVFNTNFDFDVFTVKTLNKKTIKRRFV